MTARSRYIALETFISACINTALSIAFVYLVFHGQPRVAVSGTHGIVVDIGPQTFMVALMACLVPSILTRKRVAGGSLIWHNSLVSAAPAPPWRTAVALAFALTVAVLAVSWLALPRALPTSVNFHTLLFGKAAFGLLLSSIITPWSIARVLG